MAKRSIQTSKPGFSVGIEHDHQAIRAVRLSTDGRGGYYVQRLEEVRGDFNEDANLIEGFRQIRGSLGATARDCVVACLSGKQVFATQLEFRRLAPEEMEQALRLEIRKTVHFEVATSALDYTILDQEGGSTGGPVQVMVSLAANALLKRELGLLEKAGLKASIVDVLPLAVANALWASARGEEASYPRVALHVGPQISTIVIDGEHYPFFNRSIYFAAEEVFKPAAISADRDKRIHSLCEEVARSLNFYGKSINASGFQELVLLGDYLNGETLVDRLKAASGIPARMMDVVKAFGGTGDEPAGKFDLATALALRGEP